MTPTSPFGLFRWFERVLTLYPPAFRARFGPAMARSFRDGVTAERRARGRLRSWAFAARAMADTAANGLAERRLERHRARHLHIRRDPMRSITQDLRFALRIVRRQPGVGLLSILTLAVGIGATTAVFSVVDATLLRPIALPESDRLVALMQTRDGDPGLTALDNLADWHTGSATMASVAAFRGQSVNLTGSDTPERVRGAFVSSAFFDVVGLPPVLGRFLRLSDDDPGSEPVVVIDHAIWQSRFAASHDVLGRVMQLNNVAFTIVGVAPREFEFPYDEAQVWMPIRFLPAELGRSARSVFAFGRLEPGASVEQARQEFAALNAGLARAFPEVNEGLGTLIVPLQAWLTEDVRTPIGLVFGLALVLLIAAAANVAGLQVGATSARRAEISLRVALGAGRRRVVRQILTEHVIFAVIGGVLGVLLAIAMVPMLSGSMPSLTFGLDRMAVDGRVLACAALVTVMAGLGSAVVPAMHWARQMPGDALKSGGRAAGERRLTRARSLLVAGQVGMAAVLLTSGGMLVKSYLAMTGVDPGFDGRQVYSLEYRLPANKYHAPAEQIRVHDAIVARVSEVPGVRRAATVQSLPFSGNGGSAQYVLGESVGMEPQTADMNAVSRDYFDIMGIRLLEGRGFTSEDTPGSAPVILVSRAFAERAWPAGGAVGRDVVFPDFEVRARVVGVVADVRHRSLLDALQPTFYAPVSQSAGHFMTLVAEVDGDPMARRDAIRQAIWAVDPDQPVWKERTLGSLVDRSLTSPRFTFRALMTFAAVAVLLVVAGLYGVVSQTVARRRREIGVRLALGATRRDIYRGVIGSGLVVTGAGLVAGLAAAVLVTRLIEGLLFGTSPHDAVPYAVTAVVLFVVSAAACYLPARRAASVDPARVLRE